MRVAIYARISTSESRREQDPESQLRQLREFCANAGHEIVREYIDSVSGSKGEDKRPQFDALFDDAHKRKFDMVVCWALDRFSREGMFATVGYFKRLDAAGVKFHSYMEPLLSTDNEMIRDIVLAVMAAMAKQERIRLIERTVAGMQRAREKGSRSGKPIGRPKVSAKVEAAIRESLSNGTGILKTARALRVGSGVVQRVKREMVTQ